MNVSSSVALCPTNNTLLCLSMKECLNHSGPPEECFWNQNSRVTGIFCDECVKLCRSRRTSLNFVQLLIGLLIFSPSFPIMRTVLSVLVSDGMGKEGQVILLLLSVQLPIILCFVLTLHHWVPSEVHRLCQKAFPI